MQSNTVTPMQSNSVSGTRKEGKSKNYSPVTLHTCISYLKRLDKVMRFYSIKYSSVRDLILIYDHYTRHNLGINANSIMKHGLMDNSNIRALYFRTGMLQRKGLIKCIDRKYYPTEQAIKDLNSLLKSA